MPRRLPRRYNVSALDRIEPDGVHVISTHRAIRIDLEHIRLRAGTARTDPDNVRDVDRSWHYGDATADRMIVRIKSTGNVAPQQDASSAFVKWTAV